MKYSLTLSLLFLILSACSQKKNSYKQVSYLYFQARDDQDFQAVKEVIYDSLTVIEGDYIMPYSKDSYYEVFKWDSVFQTEYKIVNLQERDDQIIATIGLSSIRNRFLENDNMTCDFMLSFHSGKIYKIESLDCKNANWQVWQDRVRTLVDWIQINHPGLDGFINDMTMTGAINYIKAIELYESNNIK